jgi:hypothetical protein
MSQKGSRIHPPNILTRATHGDVLYPSPLSRSLVAATAKPPPSLVASNHGFHTQSSLDARPARSRAAAFPSEGEVSAARPDVGVVSSPWFRKLGIRLTNVLSLCVGSAVHTARALHRPGGRRSLYTHQTLPTAPSSNKYSPPAQSEIPMYHHRLLYQERTPGPLMLIEHCDQRLTTTLAQHLFLKKLLQQQWPSHHRRRRLDSGPGETGDKNPRCGSGEMERPESDGNGQRMSFWRSNPVGDIGAEAGFCMGIGFDKFLKDK